MKLIMTLKIHVLLFASVSALALSACLVNEPPRKDKSKDNEPPECTSPLCRVETPADTSMLTPDQMEELVTVIDAADDSATVSITTINLEALSDSSLINGVLKQLQMDVLADLKIPVNPLLLSEIPIDSLLATVQMNVSGDGTINVQWSGTIADVRVDKVSLNIKGDEFLGGYAVVNGKYLTLTPLGGNMIALVYDSKVLWVGECPTTKAAATQLSCLPLP